MKNDLVSVIIPVYNVEAYLDDCIWSVRNQTYENLEIIIVNDKTPDGSMEIAKRHALEDSRIVILEHEVNSGLGAARNTGIAKASGKYVMFLDSDDSFAQDAVEVLYENIKNSNAQFVFGRMMWVKDDGLQPVEYIEHRILKLRTYYERNIREIPSDLWYLGSAVNRIYDLEWLKNNRIFFPTGVYWEDMLFSIMTWSEAQVIIAIDRIVYLRTEREGEGAPSITQTYGKKKYLDRDELIDALFNYLNDNRERYLSGDKIKKPISLYEAQQLMKRVCATTKNIVPLADEDIKPWVQEWYNEHNARCQKLIQSLH